MRRFFLGLLVAAGFAGFAACGGSGADGGGGGGAGADAGGTAQTDAGDGATSSSNDGAAPEDSATDAPADSSGTDTTVVKPFKLTSITIADNGLIPAAHTCQGADQSPPLAWSDPPAGTQSYAIVVRDLDAPDPNNNYHWVIYDIDASYTSLPQAVPNIALPSNVPGAKQTYWSFGNEYSWKGPCPPSGVHRYVFTIYSFATPMLPGGPSTSPATMDGIIQNNKTGSASLTGQYAK